jgi:hypothetical protein
MKSMCGRFSLKQYSANDKKEWDVLVEGSKSPLFMFKRDYIDYHADRFKDCSVIIYKDNKPAAALPCNDDGEIIVSHGGLTYGGLIVGADLRANDVLIIFNTTVDFFKSLGKRELIYKVVPRVFNQYPSDEELYALTRLNAQLIRRDLSSVIKISSMPKLSDSRKSTARKSFKAGAIVLELNEFDGFHFLLSSVLEKFGIKPVHSLAELYLLKSRFPDNIRLFGAVLNEQLLAAVLIYDFGDVVHTQYMASSEEGRKLGALDFVLLELIEKKFSSRGYFSFGISTEKNGRVLNEGLIRQKEGFGGRGIVHDFYKVSFNND